MRQWVHVGGVVGLVPQLKVRAGGGCRRGLGDWREGQRLGRRLGDARDSRESDCRRKRGEQPPEGAVGDHADAHGGTAAGRTPAKAAAK